MHPARLRGKGGDGKGGEGRGRDVEKEGKGTRKERESTIPYLFRFSGYAHGRC